MSSVLLITRDASTETLVERALASGGHEAITAPGCDAAIRSLFNVHVDAIVIDSAVGREDVQEFCSWLRSGDESHPIVFIASPGSRWLIDSLPADPEIDEVVVKPCEGADIRRAVEKVLNVGDAAPLEVITIGDGALDRNSHELRGNGVTVQLTPTEFRLIHYLAQRRGSIVPAEELLERVWEFFPGTGSSELVRSHVRNVRAKLRLATGGTEVLQTVPRRGYRLA